MRLFLFHDHVEEILVAAKDSYDAFDLIEECMGSDAADTLIMSKLGEYSSEIVEFVNKAEVRGLLGFGVPGTFSRKFIDA